MSAPAEAQPWTKQVLGLLHAVEKGELPIPLALSWDPYRRELGVQVEDSGYRSWMEAMVNPVVSSANVEDTLHLYASGQLKHCQMVQVRLVAVTEAKPARPVTP